MGATSNIFALLTLLHQPVIGVAMSKKWKGDEIHLLPALQVEPYRLWFEFLKLAEQDGELTVDKTIYSAWGDYRSSDFKKWWKTYWRSLFATSIGTFEITDSIPSATARLNVSLPLNQDPTQTLNQVRQLLKDRGAGQKLKSMRHGQFELSVGTVNGRKVDPSTRFLRNLPKVRLLMHLYRFWLQFPDHDERRRLEETAKAYCRWAGDWNRKVTERKWKRDKIEIPTALSEYVMFLERRGGRRRVSLVDENETDAPNHRRQLARYIRKARRIAANAAAGEFPGTYETPTPTV